MEIPDMSVTVNEPASNPNNCGKRGSPYSSEYRAAFNWPPGSQQSTTISHQIVNSGPASSTTVTTTASIKLDNGMKSQTIADFSEISATSIATPAVVNNQPPAKSISNQQSLAPGPAGLPSHLSGGVGCGFDLIKDRPQVLFTRATPSPPVDPKNVRPTTKTEYRKKFKPFSTYVYIPGSGWKKSKQITKESDGIGFTSEAGRSTSEGALEWYGEVVERAKKACEFRSRSQFGHPVVGVDHLESIYRETSLWNQPKDRSIAALALATSHHLRVSTRSTKGNSRDSSRDSSKAGSDRVTSTSNHVNAIISPSKETRKQLDGKVKPSTDKKRSGSSSTSVGTVKPSSVDSEGGKIWLKPKKEPHPPPSELVSDEGGKKDSIGGISVEGDNDDGKLKGSASGDTPATTGASSLVTSGSLTPLLSPREKESGKDESYESLSNATKSPNNSDDQPRSPRPNSLVSSITNSGSGLPSPPSGILLDGQVKTTEIKSPEEVVGVKSPSPELWQVSIEPGADINWTEGKLTSSNGTNLTDNKLTNDSIDNGMGDNGINGDTNNLNNQQLDDDKQTKTQEMNVIPSEANEDMYGPLSI